LRTPEDPLGPWGWAGLLLCALLVVLGLLVMLGGIL
jgi:hypothetical protein